MPRRDDGEGGDKPQTPASEPAQSQPASPQKKKRKVSRSHSIPAHMQTPNVTMGMEYGGPFGPRGNGMVPPGHHGSPFEGDPHGHPQWGHPMHPHMHPHPGHHSPMHPSGPPHMHPMPPMSPGAHPAGYPGPPGHHPSFMRPMSLPQHMPPSSMHGPGPGMPSHMTGCLPGEPMPNNAPPMSHGGPPSSGPYISSSGCVYPSNQPMIFNQNNPHAPPIYPCGSCHKEVNDSDQAMLCESGCNFWFHRQCTGLTEPAYTFLTKEIFAEWVCDPCLQKKNIPLIKFKP